MIATFGNRLSFGVSVFPIDEPAPFDPKKPDPRAVAEMRAFDELTPEARARIAESAFGAQVSDLVDRTMRRGATTAIRERLQKRELAPCDVGTEGVVLEAVAILEEEERARLKAELVA